MNIALVAVLLAAAQEPKKETVAIPGSKLQFEMVQIPGGKDLKPFWIGTREVTWAEYSLYYESTRDAKVDGITRPTQPDVVDPKEPFQSGVEQTPEHPATSIGWYGAMGYCEWLSAKTGQRFRLPTEREWEAAAGADPKELDASAWHKGNSGGGTRPVGSAKPNALGLYDVLGNAWENCLEPFQPPAWGVAVRGGAWNTPADKVRLAQRQLVPDEWADRDPKRPLRLWWLTDGNFVGLRLVRPADPAPRAEADALAGKLEIRNLRRVTAGKRPDYLDRCTGEIHYTGEKPLDEVEVTVFFLDEEGKPMLKDPKEKPTYNKIYPVLVHSAHEGPHRKALRKGETRSFEVDVPHPFIEAGPLELDKVGAKISGVHVSK